jgi:hypothetical protein
LGELIYNSWFGGRGFYQKIRRQFLKIILKKQLQYFDVTDFYQLIKENDLISRRFFSPEQIAYMSSINILKSNKLSQFCCD